VSGAVEAACLTSGGGAAGGTDVVVRALWILGAASHFRGGCVRVKGGVVDGSRFGA
jgi:hypothetical protein